MKKIRILLCLLLAAALVASLGVSASAEPPMSGSCGDVEWEIDSGGQTLRIKGEGAMASCVVGGSLAQPWAEWVDTVNYVEIGTGVTKIGESAFKGMYPLMSVDFPATLTEIGDNAFEDCQLLKTALIPNGVTRIGSSAFQNSGLEGTLELPASLSEIGASAFAGCTGLTSVHFPSGLKKIHAYAFQNCTGLKGALTIPDSVTMMDTGVFEGCKKLYGPVKLPAGIDYVTDKLFKGCEELRSVVFPPNTINIFESAFEGCYYFMSGVDPLELPDTLRVIGRKAFYECINMSGPVEFPASLVSIGAEAFYQCQRISRMDFRGDAPFIADDAFYAVHGCIMSYPWNAAWDEEDFRLYGGTGLIWATSIEIYAQPADIKVGEGSQACFTVGAYGGGLEYEWWCLPVGSYWMKVEEAQTDIEGAQTPTLTVLNADEHNGWKYQCKVSNAGNRVETDEALLTVDVNKPSITEQPKSVTVQEGEKAVFTVEAKGLGLSYQWQYRTSSSGTWRNTTLSGSSYKTATLTIPGTLSRSGYQYRCKVTNSGGSVNSSAATLTVKPKAPAIETQPVSATVQEGGTATFTVKAGGTGLSYQWQYRTSSSGSWKNATAEGNKTATLKVPATAGRSGNQYRCHITNAGGTVNSKAVTLTVTLNKPAITTQPKSVSAAAGNTVSFTVKASGSALSYQWQWRASSGGSWKDSTLEGCKTATLKVKATEARSGYQYRCVVKNSAGSVNSSAATLTVTQNKPSITAQPKSVSAAVGSTVSFTVKASGAGLSYQWQYRTSSTGTWSNSGLTGNKTATLKVEAKESRSGYQYRCVVKNSAGSVRSSAATLTVVTKPAITTQPKNVSVSAGMTASFTVKASGGGLSFQWQWRSSSTGAWKDCTMEGSKTATLKVPATKARNGYQYRCVITNLAGSVNSKAVTLTVK